MYNVHNVVGRRFATALLPRLFGTYPRSHHKRPPVGFELETNGFQFYATANLDKTSLYDVDILTYNYDYDLIILQYYSRFYK